jgi:hypothetical protein
MIFAPFTINALGSRLDGTQEFSDSINARSKRGKKRGR